MTTFIVWILSAVLVLTCVLLTFLVLIQLPKKDAGAGVAFGAGATDALFGAGSGNALTKLTRHSTVAFLVLSLVLWILIVRKYHPSNSGFGASVDKAAAALRQAVPPTPTPAEASNSEQMPAISTNDAGTIPGPATSPTPPAANP